MSCDDTRDLCVWGPHSTRKHVFVALHNFSELFDHVSVVAFRVDDLNMIPLDFDVSRSPMHHKVWQNPSFANR